ncbi:hypothetical protein FS837_005774 [Tulasnella sp. UAMH 9824]|nr:hypothetical protein FS837_005774 [Tulasnella sp. UAMH 9824]
MNNTTQIPLNAPLFEIPDPPEEFGQDGGKFYRCYDALANELDDDMVTGLKEQLDGMLIFAGLFAGVNTAFLALTIPLLSPDPTDDTNALLSRNNAILVQLLTGRNDSVPASPPLPSTSFSPSPDIFIINALFALSLAIAIISSFLAVLGRQWLVYYRKRSGGGPDHQRWEELKRFLGAERWRLQAILDDVLPSLLQIGLVIFCVSLILYLRHLNHTISLIVAIPMYVGLAFFIGSALCTVRDKFCPFHSPLSHLLVSAVTYLRWVRSLIPAREEETSESLQIMTLKRAICTSDDPATLLYATSNILGITNIGQMEQLWSDGVFRERFLELHQSSYARMLQLRGRDQVNIAVAARRLYCGAAAHIMLVLDSKRGSSSSWAGVQTAKEPLTSTALEELPGPSTYLVRATLRLPILRCDGDHPPDETANDICDHLATYYSPRDTHPDRRLFSVLTWVAVNLHLTLKPKHSSQGPLQQAYEGGNVESTIRTLGGALKVLTGPECTRIVDRDSVLMNVLGGIRQIVVSDQVQPMITLQHKFTLLEICEPIMQSPHLPEKARCAIRKIRLDLAQAWQQDFDSRVIYTGIPARQVDMLEKYLAGLRTIYPAEGYHEYIEVLQAFGTPIRGLFSYTPHAWANTSGFKKRIAFRETFNNFVLHVDNMARQVQVRINFYSNGGIP